MTPLRTRLADIFLGPRHTVGVIVSFPNDPDSIRMTFHGIRAHTRSAAAAAVLRHPDCIVDLPGFSGIHIEVVAEIGAASP